MLACAITVLIPWAANSFWQKARAKNPRSSSRRSKSMIKAPRRGVSVKIMADRSEQGPRHQSGGQDGFVFGSLGRQNTSKTQPDCELDPLNRALSNGRNPRCLSALRRTLYANLAPHGGVAEPGNASGAPFRLGGQDVEVWPIPCSTLARTSSGRSVAAL